MILHPGTCPPTSLGDKVSNLHWYKHGRYNKKSITNNLTNIKFMYRNFVMK